MDLEPAFLAPVLLRDDLGGIFFIKSVLRVRESGNLDAAQTQLEMAAPDVIARCRGPHVIDVENNLFGRFRVRCYFCYATGSGRSGGTGRTLRASSGLVHPPERTARGALGT